MEVVNEEDNEEEDALLVLSLYSLKSASSSNFLMIPV